MAIDVTYKLSEASFSSNMGGTPEAIEYVVCDAPQPTKANPVSRVKFGNGFNNPGLPKFYYLANPTVSR